MPINLQDALGGAQYIPRQYFINQQISYPSVNPNQDVITLQAPPGLRVRLELLYSSSANDTHTIILDDTHTVITSTLANTESAGGFLIAQGGVASISGVPSPDANDVLTDIIANKIVVRYTGGDTPTVAYTYKYSYGV